MTILKAKFKFTKSVIRMEKKINMRNEINGIICFSDNLSEKRLLIPIYYEKGICDIAWHINLKDTL